MSETDYTTNRHIPYPTGKDFIPEGPAEMQAIANALDAENRGEIDHLQAGVVKATDWNFVAAMESSSECKLESEAEVAESVAWLPLTAIGLVRSVTAKQKLKALKPASLPGAGKYMTVGIELTPTTSDGAATVSVVSGVEKATQAEAEAASPAITAGKARVRDVVILNTAGVYSIVSQLDRRRWAPKASLTLVTQGASCVAKAGERVQATAGITVTGPTSPIAGDRFGVLANGHAVTIKPGTGNLYGDFLEGVAECKLVGFQHLDLAFDGTNWFIIAGEPKREQAYGGWTARNTGTAYEPSATRPTLVILQFKATSGAGNNLVAYVKCGGSQIGTITGESTSKIVAEAVETFICPAGESWEVANTATLASLESNYLTL